MAIFQTNIFICDECGAIESVTIKTDIWSDPTVEPPKGWKYRESLTGYSNPFECPECSKKPE